MLVVWFGVKVSIDREPPVWFWEQNGLIGELLARNDRLPEDLRAELPLKRVWTPAVQDEGCGRQWQTDAADVEARRPFRQGCSSHSAGNRLGLPGRHRSRQSWLRRSHNSLPSAGCLRAS